MKSFMFFDEELRTLTVDTTGLGNDIRGTYQLKIILTDPYDVKKSYDYLINIFRSPSTVVAEWAPEIEEEKDYLKPLSKLISYRFVTPWIALNQATGNRYRNLKNEERTDYLNNLLGQNIVFISREMGIELENNIFTKVKLSSLFPKNIDENNWGAFDGEFETNFLLPNYIGIGNGITRGYGTILGLFEPDIFSKKGEISDEKTELDLELLDDPEIHEIDVQKVPRPKKSNAKSKFRKKKPKRSKKVLSEEFDIESDERPKRKKPLRQAGKSTKHGKSNKPKKSSENEINFNSEEYHKKQHSF